MWETNENKTENVKQKLLLNDVLRCSLFLFSILHDLQINRKKNKEERRSMETSRRGLTKMRRFEIGFVMFCREFIIEKNCLCFKIERFSTWSSRVFKTSVVTNRKYHFHALNYLPEYSQIKKARNSDWSVLNSWNSSIHSRMSLPFPR